MAKRQNPKGRFECEAGYAPAYYNDQGGLRPFSKDDVQQLFVSRGYTPPPELPPAIVPIALRWRVKQTLGLPLTPFTVWRKIKKSTLNPVPVTLSRASGAVQFTNGPFYRLTITVKNNTAATVTTSISTLNFNYQDEGGKTINISIAASGTSDFLIEYPNIGGIRLSGPVAILSAKGITMADYINDPDWQAIQLVGLPYKSGGISSDLYKTDKQGFVSALVDPEKACIQRTDIYAAFVKKSPLTAPDGAAMPLFDLPSGSELLASYNKITLLKNGKKTGILNDIGEMLEMVYKTAPAIYVGTQNNYTKEIQSLGVVDPANTNPENNGTYQNPVCSSTLMSATTDCWHALGLGFGTIDFLPSLTPVPSAPSAAAAAFVALKQDLHAFDYMVSSVFRTPIIELEYSFPHTVKEKWTGFEDREYAAICHFDIQQPPGATSLLPEVSLENRPVKRDAFYSEQVRLSWLRPAQQDRSPLTYAIAFKNNVTGTPVEFLNRNRPFIPGKPQPFAPSRRIDKNAPDPPGRDGSGFLRFYHDRSPLPYAGSITEKYYVAALNIFGMWSAWTIAPHLVAAKAPQVPAIVSAVFTARAEGIVTHIYPATLEIVFNYDWEDRTPLEIQLAGYFIQPPVANPPTVTNGIMMSNAGGAIEKYRVRFSGDAPQLFKFTAPNIYVAVAAGEGEVFIDPTISNGSNNGQGTASKADQRAYRVRLKLLQLNFNTQSTLWYVVYANGMEAKNPTLTSPYCKPIVINTRDPLPRNPPAFTPEIKWASLPDAGNTSRFHLKFNAVPGAKGYAVYCATELSLRDRLNGIIYPKQGNLFQRRDALNSASAADRMKAIDAFTRVNKKTIGTNEIELEISGDSGGLFIYAVSSFTDQEVESKLSDWIYVAVPEKITPSPPFLTGYIDKRPATPKAVIKINPGAGKNTSTVEIFRTNNKLIRYDVNTMGLPGMKGPTPGWQKFLTIDGVNDLMVANPLENFDYYKLEDNLAPGWSPYYYRAVGIGTDQPTNGKMPGRSPSSNLLELLPPPPANPPEISTPAIVATNALTGLRISFKSNAYVGASPYGLHSIVIYKLSAQALWQEIAGGDLPTIPKLAAGAIETPGTLVRLQKDAAGLHGYALNVPIENTVTFMVSVTDPLGRKNNSLPLTFTKPNDEVVIKDITIQRLALQVNVNFKTTVGKTTPPEGAFLLVISVRRGLVIKNLLAIAMHTIPNSLPVFPPVNAAIAGGTILGPGRLFSYGAAFRGPNISAFNLPVTVIISITNPKGIKTVKELNL